MSTYLPNVPGIYALCAGYRGGRRVYPAYVGLATSLRTRVRDHLGGRTNSSDPDRAVLINISRISVVWWWTHPDFSDRTHLQAAERIAMEVLEPEYRGRRKGVIAARKLAERPEIRERYETLFRGKPGGVVLLTSSVKTGK